jgi:hypothetical protein
MEMKMLGISHIHKEYITAIYNIIWTLRLWQFGLLCQENFGSPA